MKKSVSLLLSLLMVISIITSVPLTASAASTSDLTFELNKGGESYYVYSCKKSAKGELVIPNTYKNKPVTKIDYEAFYGCTSLTSITIPDSVTSINDWAFRRCTSLEAVTIGDGVTSIGDDAFLMCTSLKSITVDLSNKKFSSVDGVLFNKKKNTIVKYPSGKTNSTYTVTDSVTRIGYGAFRDCASLKSIIIPDSVTSIGKWAFYHCSSLESVAVGNGVTTLGYRAFSDCASLESVTIGNGVTSIGTYVFEYCTSLTSIEIPDSLISIGAGAFGDCRSLKSIKIPDSVTNIGVCAFSNCTSLASITIPDSVTSIGAYAYNGCKGLTYATIGGGVTSIGKSAFSNCTKLEEIYWNAQNVGDFYSSQNVFYNAGVNSSGIKVVFGDSVERIPANAFKNVKAITSITIPDTVKSIGYLAFYDTGYYNDRNNWDKSALYICNHLIRAKTSLKGDYTIKKGTKTIADKAFLNRENITSITIPGSVTNIGKNAFRSCKNLTAIAIPDTVKSIGYLAFYDSGYYNNRKNWDKSALYIGNHLIRARHSLTGDYQVKEGTITIADMAFRDCDKLTSVKIHSSVKNVGENIFYQCDNIKG